MSKVGSLIYTVKSLIDHMNGDRGWFSEGVTGKRLDTLKSLGDGVHL